MYKTGVPKGEYNTVKLIDGDVLVDFVATGEDTEDLFNSVVIEVVKMQCKKCLRLKQYPSHGLKQKLKN